MKKVLVGLFALALSAGSLSVAYADVNFGADAAFRGDHGGPGRGDNGRGDNGRGGDWNRGPGHGNPGHGGPGHGYPPPHGPGHGFPPPAPPRPTQVIINCSSGGYRFERCFVRGRIFNAQLVRQYSQASCQLGRTWGYEGNSIWVDKGCKGDFAAYVGF